MSRMTSNDRHIGPITYGPWSKTIGIIWSSGGGYDDEPRNSLTVHAFGWAVRLWLPTVLKPYGERYDYHARDFGFTLSDMGNGYDFMQVKYGPQTMDSSTTKSWSKHLPWMQWDHVRHSYYTPEGEHFWTEPYWKVRRNQKGDGFEFIRQREACPAAHFGFEDFDGDMRIATCHIEEREWHKGTGWFTWLKWFSSPKIHRCLNLEFDYEIGPRKGSWKGGTTGHSCDMLPGEDPEGAFRSYCAKGYEHHGKTYPLRFIGKSKPPEPAEIRVARNIGWTQCDYPHALAKDSWYHADATICADGKYASTEEMLEYIETERKKHNAGVNAACAIKP